MQLQQRVLGIVPNFYAVYDAKNAVPLTTKLKFKLALRVSVDPVTIAGMAAMAAINQAARSAEFRAGGQGLRSTLWRQIAADGLSDILIGGAVLPSLLHQDPTVFLSGYGQHELPPETRNAQSIHLQRRQWPAAAELFEPRWEIWPPAPSPILYYPQSNRGIGLVFGTFAIGTAERMLSGIAQEFILPRFTSHAAKNTSMIKDSR